jgi:hypothetical protein
MASEDFFADDFSRILDDKINGQLFQGWSLSSLSSKPLEVVYLLYYVVGPET